MPDSLHINDVGSHLRRHGIYPTGQRLAIAKVLLPRHQHVTAYELYAQLRSTGVQLSKATVYNTLNLFAEKGLVREIVVDGNHTYFDSNPAPHHHFYNVDDNVLIDMPNPVCELVPDMELPKGTQLDEVEVVVKIRNSS